MPLYIDTKVNKARQYIEFYFLNYDSKYEIKTLLSFTKNNCSSIIIVMSSTISDSSLGHLAFHGSFSPSKTANQSLPVYEKRKFPSKTGRLLQELYKITK